MIWSRGLEALTSLLICAWVELIMLSYLGRLVRLGQTRQPAEILVSISSRYGIVSYRIILAIVLQRLVTA